STAYSKDERFFATGSTAWHAGDRPEFRGARVWDSRTGEAMCPPLGMGRATTGLAFTPDGQYLYYHSASGPNLWDLRPDRRPVDDLIQFSEILSGQSIASGSVAAPFSPDKLRRKWKMLRNKYLSDFSN